MFEAMLVLVTFLYAVLWSIGTSGGEIACGKKVKSRITVAFYFVVTTFLFLSLHTFYS